jgi:hypothetical protein
MSASSTSSFRLLLDIAAVSVNGIASAVSFTAISLLAYKDATDFICWFRILKFYWVPLSVPLSVLLVESLGFFCVESCHLPAGRSWLLPFPFLSSIAFSCPVALAQHWVRAGEWTLFPAPALQDMLSAFPHAVWCACGLSEPFLRDGRILWTC